MKNYYEGQGEGSIEDALSAADPLHRLLNIMAVLRDPVLGCPWDREQSFSSIAPYTIEEAYEVADAIARNDMEELRAELGDLLLQVVFQARMAEEARLFAFPDVAEAICGKLIRRHPHIFAKKDTAGESRPWETIKKAEREEKAARRAGGRQLSLFEDIPSGLPAIQRSAKLQRRASQIGFDWPAVEPILQKLEEELSELRAEIRHTHDHKQLQRQFEEFGDLMFVLVNLGLRLGIDAEAALRAANLKFERRFEAMEAAAKDQGKPLERMSLDEMQVLWDAVKESEARPQQGVPSQEKRSSVDPTKA